MDKETKRLLSLVSLACDRWTGHKRDLERAMSVGHGRLQEILNGDQELRLRHLVGLSRLLKVRPSDFLRLAYGDDERNAPRHLEEWIDEPKPQNARRKPEPFTAAHEQRIRELIREEMAKSGK